MRNKYNGTKYIGFDEKSQQIFWALGGKGPRMSPLTHMCSVSLMDVMVKKMRATSNKKQRYYIVQVYMGLQIFRRGLT